MKVVAIVGGSRGIGLACARQFALHGQTQHLVIASRNPQSLQQAHGKLSAQFPHIKVSTIECNVAKPEQIQAMAEKTLELTDGHGANVLINSAGIAINGVLATTSVETIQSLIDTNLLGTIYACKYFSKQMITSARQTKQHSNDLPSGSIINIGSILGTSGNAGQSVYSASKSALFGLTRSLARELGGRGINVNLISPGLIDTDMTMGMSDEQKQAFVRRSCMGRTGRPEEVAKAALFLAQSPYITGQELHVDGGIF